MEKTVLKLSDIATEKKVRIVSLDGGSQFKDKLLCQGIIPGKEVEVLIGGKRHCPYVLKVNDSKIMIGCGMVNKISVEEV